MDGYSGPLTNHTLTITVLCTVLWVSEHIFEVHIVIMSAPSSAGAPPACDAVRLGLLRTHPFMCALLRPFCWQWLVKSHHSIIAMHLCFRHPDYMLNTGTHIRAFKKCRPQINLEYVWSEWKFLYCTEFGIFGFQVKYQYEPKIHDNLYGWPWLDLLSSFDCTRPTVQCFSNFWTTCCCPSRISTEKGKLNSPFKGVSAF